jgi:hypothetical protein
MVSTPALRTSAHHQLADVVQQRRRGRHRRKLRARTLLVDRAHGQLRGRGVRPEVVFTQVVERRRGLDACEVVVEHHVQERHRSEAKHRVADRLGWTRAGVGPRPRHAQHRRGNRLIELDEFRDPGERHVFAVHQRQQTLSRHRHRLELLDAAHQGGGKRLFASHRPLNRHVGGGLNFTQPRGRRACRAEAVGEGGAGFRRAHDRCGFLQ